MSQWTASRKFRNAKGTVSISVCALIQSHPFVAAATNGNVIDILATGGLLPRNDEERDEAARLMEYVRNKYIGRVKSDFENAREIVMGHNIKVEKKPPGITIVNTIEMPNLSSPEAARRIAEACRRPLYENRCRARFDNVERFVGMPKELGAGYSVKSTSGDNVSANRFFDAPTLGTYWREKARNKDYQVIAVSEHEHCVTVRMQRTTNDGVFDFQFFTKNDWLERFEQAFRIHDEFYTDPYAALAATMKDVPYSAQRVSLEALRPQRRWFVIDPRQVGKTEAHAIAGAFRAEYPELAEMWKGKEHELPPAEGERYQSLIMGRNIYRVLDARRKLHSEDWYITMIRECDGHKAKFTYRDHATWFLVWVPVIDEEEPVRKGNVTVTLDTSAASEALKKVGESMHEAAAEFVKYMDSDGSLHDLVRIMDELHKRVPSWNQNATTGPELDEASLAIRAIRTLAKRSQTATDNWQRAEDKVAELLKAKNHFQQRVTVLESQRRVLPAVGSVWRTNSTGTYATVTHVFAESGMAKMRSAKGAEYDLPLDRLFEYSTLATGPAALVEAIGEIQCNAPGLTKHAASLKTMFEDSVLHVRELQRSSTGDVTVHGFITAKKPKEG